MKLFVSNRIEILASRLAQVLEEPLSSPFEKEIVVVQSRGMERWLSLKLAGHHGVCANTTFPFPNAMIMDLFRRVLKNIPEESPFDTGVMAWRIMALLPRLMDMPGFETIRGYVRGDTTGLRLHQLSCHLAETFDQYVIFRPEAVLSWQQGRTWFPGKESEPESWQAILWRELVRGHEEEHRAALKKRFMDALARGVKDHLPERLSIFGIAFLPLFHLEIFHAVSRYIPVHLFLMNPCSHYWGDIRSGREMARIALESPEASRQELYLEEGNSLLASLGGLGRQLFDVLQEFEADEVEGFEETPGMTLLGCVQNDILNLENPCAEHKRAVSFSDTSIQVHSCHSPMREVEVLHDNLLALFEKIPDLTPEDIMVMTPEIETYAPFIQAVFDRPRSDPEYIPFGIADRSFRTDSELAGTFLDILDLAGSRLEASRVVGVLESRAVRARFDLADADLELIRRWVQDTRICWGMDAGNKVELGLPPYGENTWRFGLDRLLMGYAMHAGPARDFAGILAYDDVEGDDAVVLGSFLSFVFALFSRVRMLTGTYRLGQWSELLLEMLDEFFLVDEPAEPHLHGIRTILAGLAGIQEKTRYEEVLSLDVIRSHVAKSLEMQAEGKGFLSGGVTFCAMLPMRSIPFKVVCLLGMNHGTYPRQQRSRGFDLIARNPRRGDRSRRDDDLYLFLEALLSAREVLYVSYLGQSMEDNTEIPPSVLLSSLMDYIGEGFILEDGTNMRDHILTRQYLQAFNPHYFLGGEKHFTYSRENMVSAQGLIREDKRERVFWEGTLSDPGDEWRMVDINALCDFYANPARFLLKNRLGIVFPGSDLSLEDREPFELEGLDLYRLQQDHIRNSLAGLDHERSYELFRMSGQLPHGAPGDSLFSRLSRQTDGFIETVRRSCAGYGQEDVLVDVRIGDFMITGTIPTFGRRRLVRFRHADLKGVDLLRTWIAHLVLCAAASGENIESCCIAKDSTMTLGRVDACSEILSSLLNRYWQGLVKPLPFFPQASWRYAAPGRNRDMSAKDPLGEARSAWEGTPYKQGEGSDTYCRVCFQGRDPLDEEFAAVSVEIYGPLLSHARIAKGPGAWR